MARWVYRVSDGWISHRCQYPDAVKTGDFETIEIPDDQPVDPERDRIDQGQVRRLTQAELAARVEDQRQRRAVADSRREDVLTTIAWVVRRGNPAAFDALTADEKRTLVRQQAEVWRGLRALFDQGELQVAGRLR